MYPKKGAYHRILGRQNIFAFRLSSQSDRTPRQFTQASRLRLVYPNQGRPQLPFLHPGILRQPTQHILRTQLRRQLARLLSTQTKSHLKYQALVTVQYTVSISLILILLWSLQTGITFFYLDKNHPCPREWSLWTRFYWQYAKKLEQGDTESGFISWPGIVECYLKVLARLEDTSIDGIGILPVLGEEEGDILVEGVGRTGFDVSRKSEEWRRSYFESLLGMAKASENVEGLVVERGTNMVFTAASVIGPSNPNPKPLTKGGPAAPREENVYNPFEEPTKYYLKILTTHGFTSRQRLEGALAYADWLDYKGLTNTAGDMYDWGLDIAMGSLPQGTRHAANIRTGVISDQADHVSSNLLTASTSLAGHQARQGNFSAALPILLSVLRARRQLEPPTTRQVDQVEPENRLEKAILYFKAIFKSFPMADAPPTGDESPERTPVAICEEAGVMANIGELLFAMATQAKSKAGVNVKGHQTALKGQEDGLSWTREAVDLAQSTLNSVPHRNKDARKRCLECLQSGADDWTTMMTTMLKNEQEANSSLTSNSKKGWIWGEKSLEKSDRWECEAKAVEERLEQVRKLLYEEERKKHEKSMFAALTGN